MIKARTLIVLFMILVIAGRTFGDTVYLNGTITDLQGTTRVPNHKVYIKTDFSSPFHYYKTVYTDANGYYADTVQNVPAYPVSFQISTYDCNNIAQLITGLSTNSPIVADFHICIPPYYGCRANFTCDSIIGLDYQFIDQSQSNSTIISWKWNFGDIGSGVNNISSSQNPQHSYTGSGIYNVKLIIHSAGGCIDSIIKTVFIRIPYDRVIIWGHITNDQNNQPISDNPVMINSALIEYSNVVYSNSNGVYADTIAAIPDGIPISVATYDCTNILHSNTVYSNPSPMEVDFSICLDVQCRAGFSAVLDSNNKAKNTYLFTDLSYGDPNKWYWNFGDGTTSSEKNPVHQFTTSGNYTVYLTITKMDTSGAWNCFDSTDRIVKTCSYYNVGGLLYAGQFPINNPHYSGDTGVAYLYRAHNQWIVPVDTTSFTWLGYYTFIQELEGSYIIKAGLTEGSSHYKEYLPAYNSDQLKWQTATSFMVDNDIFNNDIHLVTANDSLSGPASLQGSVILNDDTTKLPDAEVLLFTNELNPVKVTFSNAEGNFEFPALPFGTYNLYPEVTGKFTRILQVTIDSLHPVADGLQLKVYNHEVTGIAPVQDKNDITFGKIYPNPVTEDFQFRVLSPNILTINAEILTLTGERILLKNIDMVQGINLLTIPLRNVINGMYFLVIKSVDGRILNTQKIIKN
jgi:PKD repeat protein